MADNFRVTTKSLWWQHAQFPKVWTAEGLSTCSENGYRLDRTNNELGLPTFKVTESGEISLLHDGTVRRGWLSLQFIFLVVVLVMALPAGRRKSEISEEELA